MLLIFSSAAGGEIFDQCVADREEAFKEKDVQRLMRQILEGVRFLHAHDVVHLDLKVRAELLYSFEVAGEWHSRCEISHSGFLQYLSGLCVLLGNKDIRIES